MSKHRPRNFSTTGRSAEPEHEVPQEEVIEDAAGDVTEEDAPEVEPVPAAPIAPPVQPAQPPRQKPMSNEMEIFMMDYIGFMETEKSLAKIAIKQYALYTKLMAVLRDANAAAFRSNWNTLLNAINAAEKAAKGNPTGSVLSMYNAFQAAHSWPGSTTEYSIFRQLLTTAIVTADPATRSSAMNAVSMKALTASLTPEQANNLIAFYEA